MPLFSLLLPSIIPVRWSLSTYIEWVIPLSDAEPSRGYAPNRESSYEWNYVTHESSYSEDWLCSCCVSYSYTVSPATASVLHGRSREEGPHNRKTTGNGAHNNNIHKTKPGDCSPVPKYQRGNKIKSSLFLAVQWPYVLACGWINITLYGFYCC